MSELQSVMMLRNLLGIHFDWHGARLDLVARFILALFQVRTVNLSRLATVLCVKVKTASNDLRLQRFFRHFEINQDDIAQFVASFLPADTPWILALDRTNWKLGKTNINFLVLGVCYGGLSIPLFWIALPKAGNSNTKERIFLLDRFFKIFPNQEIAFLLGDREFVGGEWFRYLLQHGIPFRIRLKNNFQLTSTKGKTPILDLFRHLDVGQTCCLRQPRRLWGCQVFLSAKRLEDGSWLLIASNRYSRNVIEEYAIRWEIETLFAALKTHGFSFEDTHLTKPERLENLLALLTIATVWAVQVGMWGDSQKPIKIKKTICRKQSSFFRYGLDALSRWIAKASECVVELVAAFGFLLNGQPLLPASAPSFQWP
jgi:hypothetical protein